MSKYSIPLNGHSPQGWQECVQMTKDLGAYIQNNAESLVGDIGDTRSINFNFRLAVNEIPTLTIVKQRYLRIDPSGNKEEQK